MGIQIDSVIQALEAAKKLTKEGGEYWTARNIQAILGYTAWENFEKVINKARIACESSGVQPEDQFHGSMKMIEGGKGAMLPRKDYFLTRYACYLIAMNGDASKPEIATAR